jgi:hypothetical protein
VGDARAARAGIGTQYNARYAWLSRSAVMWGPRFTSTGPVQEPSPLGSFVRVRNPWNEYECGNYYARAMASYALLGALAGFRYSAVQRTLWFGPQLSTLPFKTFFSTASGFGTVMLDSRSLSIQIIEGELRLEKMVLTDRTQTRTLDWKTTVRPGAPAIKNI